MGEFRLTYIHSLPQNVPGNLSSSFVKCSPCRSNIAPLLLTESEDLLKKIVDNNDTRACTAGDWSLGTAIQMMVHASSLRP